MTDADLSDLAKVLIKEFAASEMRELHVRRGDFEIYLSSDPRAAGRVAARSTPAQAPVLTQGAKAVEAVQPDRAERQAPAAPSAPTADVPDGAVTIVAPNLGTFYRAPKPGAANYVEVGSKVSVGDELCLIEVMKLFTALQAEAAGTIHAVLVEDGAMVDAGQPLFVLTED